MKHWTSLTPAPAAALVESGSTKTGSRFCFRMKEALRQGRPIQAIPGENLFFSLNPPMLQFKRNRSLNRTNNLQKISTLQRSVSFRNHFHVWTRINEWKRFFKKCSRPLYSWRVSFASRSTTMKSPSCSCLACRYRNVGRALHETTRTKSLQQNNGRHPRRWVNTDSLYTEGYSFSAGCLSIQKHPACTLGIRAGATEETVKFDKNIAFQNPLSIQKWAIRRRWW